MLRVEVAHFVNDRGIVLLGFACYFLDLLWGELRGVYYEHALP